MKTKKKIVYGVETSVVKARLDDVAKGWYKASVKFWRSTIHLFVGSIDEMIESGRKRFKDEPEVLEEIGKFAEGHATAFAAVRFCGENDFVVRIKSFRPCLIEDILTLSHESLHVAQRLLHNVGAEVNPTGSETLAYTHEYIFGHLMHEILKGGGGRNGEGTSRGGGK